MPAVIETRTHERIVTVDRLRDAVATRKPGPTSEVLILPPDLQVIITTLNSERFLPHLVAGLAGFTRVVVVD